MIISHSRKLIFIHVPKTGGTSIETALAPHLDWSDLILGSTELGEAMNAPFRNRYGLFDHCAIDDVVSVCGAGIFDRYYSFALVRHPIDRAASVYNFVAQMCRYPCVHLKISLDHLRDVFLVRPHDDPEKMAILKRWPFMSWGAIDGYLRSDGFSDFIRHTSVLSDFIFFPQVDFVQSLDGAARLTEIVKLEEVHHFVPKLSHKLGDTVVIGHENRSEHKAITAQTISTDDKLYLRHHFDADFLAFEYD